MLWIPRKKVSVVCQPMQLSLFSMPYLMILTISKNLNLFITVHYSIYCRTFLSFLKQYLFFMVKRHSHKKIWFLMKVRSVCPTVATTKSTIDRLDAVIFRSVAESGKSNFLGARGFFCGLVRPLRDYVALLCQVRPIYAYQSKISTQIPYSPQSAVGALGNKQIVIYIVIVEHKQKF
jgi:hypothetical protein